MFRHPNDSLVSVDKTVVVVIDALRTDHLVTATVPLMPYLQTQLAAGGAHGYILHTAAPTVTLPRIKVGAHLTPFLEVGDNT